MPLDDDAEYVCPYCWEQNFIGIDRSAGRSQSFTEDCPVCCNPIAFDVRVDPEGIEISCTRDD